MESASQENTAIPGWVNLTEKKNNKEQTAYKLVDVPVPATTTAPGHGGKLDDTQHGISSIGQIVRRLYTCFLSWCILVPSRGTIKLSPDNQGHDHLSTPAGQLPTRNTSAHAYLSTRASTYIWHTTFFVCASCKASLKRWNAMMLLEQYHKTTAKPSIAHTKKVSITI